MSAVPDWVDDYINEQLANGSPSAPPLGAFVEGRDCPHCGHHEHGLPCQKCTGPPGCESSWTTKAGARRPTTYYSHQFRQLLKGATTP